MIKTLYLTAFAVLGLSLTSHAQEKKKVIPIQIRAVLHDPIRPVANLFYTNETGVVVPMDFRPKALTRALSTLPLNGSLVLYDKAEIDPEDPMASMAASVKLPQNLTKAIVVVLPTPAGKEPAYQMLVIDDSEKAFPKGEQRVLSLIGIKTAIQAGEHRLPIDPGKIIRVPPVKKVNEYNIAQTNFYYQKGNAWVVFTERQLQYQDAYRRLFIVYSTPGAVAPRVTTIVDTKR